MIVQQESMSMEVREKVSKIDLQHSDVDLDDAERTNVVGFPQFTTLITYNL